MAGTSTIVIICACFVVGGILCLWWSSWKGKKDVRRQEQLNSVDVEEQITQNAQQQEQHNSADVETQTTQTAGCNPACSRAQPLNLNNFAF
jgi:cytoskeletal protein RodZ